MSPISSIQAQGVSRAGAAQLSLNGGGFGRSRARTGDGAGENAVGAGAAAAPPGRKELEKRLGELIGSALLMPVLKKMQDSPFKTKYSSGGKSEGVFKGQLALELSQKTGRAMSHGFARKLVDAVERRQAATQSDSSGNSV